MTTEKIEVEPVTRVEGHGKVTLNIQGGKIKNVEVNIIEPPRFFEKLLEGKPAEEAPRITERICGVCPVAHHLASAKAVEAAWDVEVPETAIALRRLLLLAQFINSHALHIGFLSLPDLLRLREKSVFGLSSENPKLLERVLQVHSFGVKLTEEVGGRTIHPITAVPGGMSKPFESERRDQLLRKANQVLESTTELASLMLDIAQKGGDLFEEIESTPTNYMSMHRDGIHELYDGRIRVIDSKGNLRQDFDPSQYFELIEEKPVEHSYVKYPYLKSLGFPQGIYRVGPLARVNSASISATGGRSYVKSFFGLFGRPAHHPLAYNLARAIELVHVAQQAADLLADDNILKRDVRAPVKPKKGEGVGVVEAPRGTLIHHYSTDERGLIEKANLIVATGQNVPSMEKEVRNLSLRLEDSIVDGDRAEAIWKIETLIRAYDPCISCATHLVEIKRRD
jgi:F420-non-reducing hydrogenase large subunit